MTVLPKSRTGKWSVWLIVAFILLMLFFFTMTGLFHQRGGGGFFDNLLLTVPILLAFGCAIASFVTGLVAVIGARDYAAVVFISVLMGFFVLLYGAAEIAFPH